MDTLFYIVFITEFIFILFLLYYTNTIDCFSITVMTIWGNMLNCLNKCHNAVSLFGPEISFISLRQNIIIGVTHYISILCEIHPFVGWTRHAVHFLLTSQHKQCGDSETSFRSDCVLSLCMCRMKGTLRVGFHILWYLKHRDCGR